MSLVKGWRRSVLRMLGLQRTKRRYAYGGVIRKLRFEICEDRRLLATFLVTSAADGVVTGPGDQPGTLRQAVFDANNLAGDDEIRFSIDPSHGLNGGDDRAILRRAFPWRRPHHRRQHAYARPHNRRRRRDRRSRRQWRRLPHL